MPTGVERATRALGPWLDDLLESHRAEIRTRALVLHLELDPGFVIETSEALNSAFRGLLRLILATVPDGCEIYLGAARSTAPVSRVGAGQWSARWQVMGNPAPNADRKQAQIHPQPGDARVHVQSSLAKQVVELFGATGWEFALETLESGRELLARGLRR